MRTKVVRIQADDPEIISPSGLNCSLCRAYLRDRNACPGCRGANPASRTRALLAPSRTARNWLLAASSSVLPAQVPVS
jgi:hypothetical protein